MQLPRTYQIHCNDDNNNPPSFESEISTILRAHGCRQAHVRFTRSNLTVEVQGGSTAVLPVRDPHCPTPVTPAAPAVVDLPAGLTWSLKLTVRSQYDLEQLSQPPVLVGHCSACNISNISNCSAEAPLQFATDHSAHNPQWRTYLWQQQQQQQQPVGSYLNIHLAAALVIAEATYHIRCSLPARSASTPRCKLAELAASMLRGSGLSRLTAPHYRPYVNCIKQEHAAKGAVPLWSWISAAPYNNSAVLLQKKHLSSEARCLVALLHEQQQQPGLVDPVLPLNPTRQQLIAALQRLLQQYQYNSNGAAPAATAAAEGRDPGPSRSRQRQAPQQQQQQQQQVDVDEGFIVSWLSLRGLSLQDVKGAAANKFIDDHIDYCIVCGDSDGQPHELITCDYCCHVFHKSCAIDQGMPADVAEAAQAAAVAAAAEEEGELAGERAAAAAAAAPVEVRCMGCMGFPADASTGAVAAQAAEPGTPTPAAAPLPAAQAAPVLAAAAPPPPPPPMGVHSGSSGAIEVAAVPATPAAAAVRAVPGHTSGSGEELPASGFAADARAATVTAAAGGGDVNDDSSMPAAANNSYGMDGNEDDMQDHQRQQQDQHQQPTWTDHASGARQAPNSHAAGSNEAVRAAEAMDLDADAGLATAAATAAAAAGAPAAAAENAMLPAATGDMKPPLVLTLNIKGSTLRDVNGAPKQPRKDRLLLLPQQHSADNNSQCGPAAAAAAARMAEEHRPQKQQRIEGVQQQKSDAGNGESTRSLQPPPASAAAVGSHVHGSSMQDSTGTPSQQQQQRQQQLALSWRVMSLTGTPLHAQLKPLLAQPQCWQLLQHILDFWISPPSSTAAGAAGAGGPSSDTNAGEPHPTTQKPSASSTRLSSRWDWPGLQQSKVLDLVLDLHKIQAGVDVDGGSGKGETSATVTSQTQQLLLRPCLAAVRAVFHNCSSGPPLGSRDDGGDQEQQQQQQQQQEQGPESAKRQQLVQEMLLLCKSVLVSGVSGLATPEQCKLTAAVLAAAATAAVTGGSANQQIQAFSDICCCLRKLPDALHLKQPPQHLQAVTASATVAAKQLTTSIWQLLQDQSGLQQQHTNQGAIAAAAAVLQGTRLYALQGLLALLSEAAVTLAADSSREWLQGLQALLSCLVSNNSLGISDTLLATTYKVVKAAEAVRQQMSDVATAGYINEQQQQQHGKGSTIAVQEQQQAVNTLLPAFRSAMLYGLTWGAYQQTVIQFQQQQTEASQTPSTTAVDSVTGLTVRVTQLTLQVFETLLLPAGQLTAVLAFASHSGCGLVGMVVEILHKATRALAPLISADNTQESGHAVPVAGMAASAVAAGVSQQAGSSRGWLSFVGVDSVVCDEVASEAREFVELLLETVRGVPE